MNLILFEPGELPDERLRTEAAQAEAVVRVDGVRAQHMLQVLRVAVGQDLRIGIVDGGVGIGTVTAIEDRRVEIRYHIAPAVPERPAIDLLLALPRPKVLLRLWPQLAALGLGRIILTNAARVERNYFDTHVLTEEIYRPLLLDGLQQARDTRLPIVSIHRQFRILVEDHLDTLCPDGLRLVAHPGRDRALSAAAREQPQARVLLAIGPEGGWNAFELRLLDAYRFQRVDMGPRTLRTDTACIALLALLHDARRAG